MNTKKTFMTRILAAAWLLWAVFGQSACAATSQDRYYAHDAVEDQYGVIAPWYQGQNGQLDLRARVSAELLKRYPWVTTDRAAGTAPEYTFNSTWRVAPDGSITIPPYRSNWTDGDRGQMCARTLHAWVEYYCYTGDPEAIAHIEAVANNLVDHTIPTPTKVPQ
jgi:hypothetical protein